MSSISKLFIYLYLVICFCPRDINAQNNSEIAGAAAVIGSAVAMGIAVEQIKEQIELNATEYILKNHPDLKQFNLKILRLDGKKISDISRTSVIIFRIREFKINSDGIADYSDDKKKILFAFTSHGWVNNNGVNYSRMKWQMVDKDEWLNMMVAYSKLASKEDDIFKLKEILTNGKITKNGIRSRDRKKDKIDFHFLDGDSYVVADYSVDYKFVYNENSLGIFINETDNLVQIGRNDVSDIHYFLTTEGREYVDW